MGGQIGATCVRDRDHDGIEDSNDACLTMPSADDNCTGPVTSSSSSSSSADSDGDGVSDALDNCPGVENPAQLDTDNDNVGNACDNCPNIPNSEQADTDLDLVGDSCTPSYASSLASTADGDGDGVPDSVDNCPQRPNPSQANFDDDALGDVCDGDQDGDGLANFKDVCEFVPNTSQTDSEYDGYGDACRIDIDGDGVDNAADSCPFDPIISNHKLRLANALNLGNGAVLTAQGGANSQFETHAGGNEFQYVLSPGSTSANYTVAVALSAEKYTDVTLEATVYVDSAYAIRHGTGVNGAVGIVWSYQSRGSFYLASWRGSDGPLRNGAFSAQSGLMVRRINSEGQHDSRSDWVSDHLYHGSASPPGCTDDSGGCYTKVLAEPEPPSSPKPWVVDTAYRMRLDHSASSGTMRLRIYGTVSGALLRDTGTIIDSTVTGGLTGGRVGLYAHEQPGVIFSNVRVRCLTTHSYALSLSGVGAYARIGTAPQLGLVARGSLSVMARVRLGGYNASARIGTQPLFSVHELAGGSAGAGDLYFGVRDDSLVAGWRTCRDEGKLFPDTMKCSDQPASVCQTNAYFRSQCRSYCGECVAPEEVVGTVVLSAATWHDVAFVYNADQLLLALYLDGQEDGLISTTPFAGGGDMLLGLAQALVGGDGTSFQGDVASLRVYASALSSEQVRATTPPAGAVVDLNMASIRGTTIDNTASSNPAVLVTLEGAHSVIPVE